MSEHIFNLTGHRELWDWLSKNPGKGEEEWPRWIHYEGGDLDGGKFNCFACVYATHNGTLECGNCPLIWPKGDYRGCENDIYNDWYSAIDRGSYQVASLLAEEIRDLPVKPGVKCK